MCSEQTSDSLVEVLIERADTGFDGRQIDESRAEKLSDNMIHEDNVGNYYSYMNDYIGTREVNGQVVGILVADEDDKNTNVDVPNPDIPHLVGLYVWESHRSNGIASELVDEFMSTVENDTCIVDCEESVKPFYEQLDWDVIYLSEFKSLRE